jgi:hypothetical protein
MQPEDVRHEKASAGCARNLNPEKILSFGRSECCGTVCKKMGARIMRAPI